MTGLLIACPGVRGDEQMWGRGLSLEIVHEGSRRFADIWGEQVLETVLWERYMADRCLNKT